MLIATLQFILALLIGAMVFFPSVVAPRVFKTLEPDQARAFLRALFPAYYSYIIILSAIGAGLMLPINTNGVITLSAISLITLFVRQILVPKINDARNKAVAGDAKAEKRFNTGHRLSVFINIVQMLVLIALFLHIAARS